MSYILDALRKSEQSRQMAVSQSTSVLHPVKTQHERKSWLIPGLLSLVAILSIGIVWLILTPTQTPKIQEPISVKKVPLTPPALELQSLTVPGAHSKIQTPEPAQRKLSSLPASKPQQPEAPQAKAGTDSAKVVERNDPLKDLPPLNISGFIHNGQADSLAMINNRLVHEGEEISPGLRLEKIKENSAIFSYKGYVFSR